MEVILIYNTAIYNFLSEKPDTKLCLLFLLLKFTIRILSTCFLYRKICLVSRKGKLKKNIFLFNALCNGELLLNTFKSTYFSNVFFLFKVISYTIVIFYKFAISVHDRKRIKRRKNYKKMKLMRIL